MDPRKHFSALNIIHRIIEEKVHPNAAGGKSQQFFLLMINYYHL